MALLCATAFCDTAIVPGGPPFANQRWELPGQKSKVFWESADFNENDVLYALEWLGGGPGGARNLVTVNTSNGAVTTVGSTVAGLDALAFQITATAVPEPSTLAMLGMASVSFAGYFGWRRRKQAKTV